jgi:polyferredoxin
VLCEKACPTLSITPRAAQSGQPLLSCMKCGACVDARVRDAAVWPIKGTEAGASSERARLMHLYSAWAFAVMFGWFQSAIGAAHVRIDPTYSGGEISHVIERPDYRI